MKQRVHTSRANRDLTLDGLDKHHHEDRTLKTVAKAAKTKTANLANLARQAKK